MAHKLLMDIDKRKWHPSPLLGQIVLVTTVNEDGVSNVAPKSWISMMAFEPPILALGCNLAHWTAQNILARQEFVVNVVGADLVETVWECHRLPHPRPVESVGLAPIPATVVRPPLISECKAHLECRLNNHLAFGEEVVLFGEIVAVSVDEAICHADNPYELLRIPLFMEDGMFGVVAKAHMVSEDNEIA